MKEKTYFRKLLARMISSLAPGKVLRHRMRGLIEFGILHAASVARQNWSMRNVVPAHYLTVCAIAKNESKYFKEWIEWYTAHGVEKFFIYDNESMDGTHETLLPYIESGLVEYRFIVGKKMQTAAYDDCLARHRYDARWIAFIDLDEFIVPIKYTTIPEFLKDYEKYTAVEINWLCYGSGGAKTRVPGKVMERFRTHSYPDYEQNRQIKSIVNPRLVLNFISSHHPTHLSGYSVDTNGQQVRRYFLKRQPLHDKIRINHYAVKSYEEFIEKRARGRGMSYEQRSMDYFERFDRNDVKDKRQYLS